MYSCAVYEDFKINQSKYETQDLITASSRRHSPPTSRPPDEHSVISAPTTCPVCLSCRCRSVSSSLTRRQTHTQIPDLVLAINHLPPVVEHKRSALLLPLAHLALCLSFPTFSFSPAARSGFHLRAGFQRPAVRSGHCPRLQDALGSPEGSGRCRGGGVRGQS